MRFLPATSRPGVEVIGIEALDRTLADLANQVAPRAMRAGISAGATVVKKVMRHEINSTSFPSMRTETPDVSGIKAAARKSIGHTIKRRAAGYQLKIGFGVGRRGAKRDIRLSKGKTRGKGISARNIHWWVLGTRERRKKTTGQEVGSLEAVFDDVIRNAWSAARTSFINWTSIAARQTMLRLARRAANKHRAKTRKGIRNVASRALTGLAGRT